MTVANILLIDMDTEEKFNLPVTMKMVILNQVFLVKKFTCEIGTSSTRNRNRKDTIPRHVNQPNLLRIHPTHVTKSTPPRNERKEKKMLRTKLPSPLGEGQNKISRTRPIKSGEGLNLYIARINRLARRRYIQELIYNAFACAITSYFALLFAYWLFSYPTLYLSFANILPKNLHTYVSKAVS